MNLNNITLLSALVISTSSIMFLVTMVWVRRKEQVLLSSRFDTLQEIAEGTHTIVNNQRSMLLRLNAELRERIARENPNDMDAQAAAVEARAESDRAELTNPSNTVD